MASALWHVCSGRVETVVEDGGYMGPWTKWPEDDRGNSKTPRNPAQRKMYQTGFTAINKGDPWLIPSSVVPDFFILTWRNSTGAIVVEQERPARFNNIEEFFTDDATKNRVVVTKDNPFGGQATDITDLPNGDYDVSIKVNPKYGETAPGGEATIGYNVNGENCNVRPPLTFGTFKA